MPFLYPVTGICIKEKKLGKKKNNGEPYSALRFDILYTISCILKYVKILQKEGFFV